MKVRILDLGGGLCRPVAKMKIQAANWSVVRPVSTSLTCLSSFSLLLSRSALIAAPQQVFQGSAAMGPTARWSTNITRRRSAGQRGRNHPNGERNWGALNTRPNYDLLSHVTLHPPISGWCSVHQVLTGGHIYLVPPGTGNVHGTGEKSE